MEIQNCIAVEQFTEEIKGSWPFLNFGESGEILGKVVKKFIKINFDFNSNITVFHLFKLKAIIIIYSESL